MSAYELHGADPAPWGGPTGKLCFSPQNRCRLIYKRPRHTHSQDAAYCSRWSGVVCLFLVLGTSVSLAKTAEPTDRDAVWGPTDSCGPRNHVYIG